MKMIQKDQESDTKRILIESTAHNTTNK